jgi:hypothetical protein
MMQTNFACHQTFTTKQEISSADYVLQSSDTNHPLTTVACRHLGYKTAIKSNINMSDTWAEE